MTDHASPSTFLTHWQNRRCTSSPRSRPVAIPRSFAALRSFSALRPFAALLVATLALCGSYSASAQTPPQPVTSLELSQLSEGLPVALLGSLARMQLIVTGVTADGQRTDLTRRAQYLTEPLGLVAIDATGHMTPVAEGTGTLTVLSDGLTLQTPFTISGLLHPRSVSFNNQVVPIFYEAGL